jgi:hypothetical protein
MIELTPELAKQMCDIAAARAVLRSRGLRLSAASPLELALRPLPKQRLSADTLGRRVRMAPHDPSGLSPWKLRLLRQVLRRTKHTIS